MAYDYSGAITAKVKAAKKNRLKARMSWGGKGRGYEFPEELISAIKDPEYQLAARLQLEGGVRAEGVGFPRSQFSKAVLTLANLHGIVEDPYFRDGRLVGVLETTEKGGYTSRHYITPATYQELEIFIILNGSVGGTNFYYKRAIDQAAKATGQYLTGRGTHGLKHNFANNFYAEAVRSGKSHESAMLEISKRCSHHRADVAPTYYIGRR